LEGLVRAMFWEGKKVFVTGHTGFKGSWLSLWLQLNGATVTGYALPPMAGPNLFELARVAETMTSIVGDVRDLDALSTALHETKPEIVIHMAAQALVRPSYADPVTTYATNVMGTVHLLEAVRRVKNIRAVLIVTSDKCYENKEWLWGYRENEPMGGFDPYSSSKGCAELVTSAFRSSIFPLSEYQQHGVALASVRAGNVIGGGDWAEDRLIPDIIRAFLKSQVAVLRKPAAIRPWQHVLDPLHGYLLLAEKLYNRDTSYAEAWNFGPENANAVPVSWIAQEMVRLWGKDAGFVVDGEDQVHEANLLRLDSSKARQRLGWQCRIGLPDCLLRIVEWYKAYEEGSDMRELTTRQIQSYDVKANQVSAVAGQ
jgi:CDP-glucose 4,6-dehydratase